MSSIIKLLVLLLIALSDYFSGCNLLEYLNFNYLNINTNNNFHIEGIYSSLIDENQKLFINDSNIVDNKLANKEISELGPKYNENSLNLNKAEKEQKLALDLESNLQKKESFASKAMLQASMIYNSPKFGGCIYLIGCSYALYLMIFKHWDPHHMPLED